MKKDPGENGCDVVPGCAGETPTGSDSNWAEPDDDVPTTGALPFESVGVLGGDFGKCSSFGFIDEVVTHRDRKRERERVWSVCA